MTEEQFEAMKEKIEQAKRVKRKRTYKWKAAAAAAAAAVTVMLMPNVWPDAAYAMDGVPFVGNLVNTVSFQSFRYEDERNRAEIAVDKIAVSETDMQQKESLETSAEEINAEIERITDEIVNEFNKNLEQEQGRQDIVVKTELLQTTDQYFTLKLICYQGAGSGAEWDYFYTIDLNTGERIALKELFSDGADYIGAISENIKLQMAERMAQDENAFYWLDYEKVPEWSFTAITDETSFYVNEDGNIVICFNEGDVAPMYMGCVEFVIAPEVLTDIRK